MRTPRNDAVAVKKGHPQPLHKGVEGSVAQRAGTPLPDFREGLGVGPSSLPERTCILTRAHGSRAGLIRLALGPDGRVLPDVRAKAPGRGAWIGVARPDLERAIAKGKLKGALARAFRTSDFTVPDDLAQATEDALRRAALDRLGLEARASTVLTGSERIAEAARKGTLKALYHASDAGTDGNRKLDQAWRVGEDDEGSGRQGLVLSVDRPILSVALGRENVVHIGVIDAGAAERVGSAIDRWHRFIDYPRPAQSCAIVAQGSGPRDVAGYDISKTKGSGLTE